MSEVDGFARADVVVASLNRLLAGILDEAPLGVSVLNATSTFLYVNAAMAGLHGVPVEDHRGRMLSEVLPGVAPAITDALGAAIGEGVVTVEIPVEGPSPHDPASVGYWLMSVSPWRGTDGTVVGASVVARDVTEAMRSVERQAESLAQERSFSRALQEAMLTRLPEPDHLELRARYLPATQDAAVGGDWYDAVVNSDGAVAVIIGDVSGHDSNAAADMGQLRGVLRAYVWDSDEDPGAIVGRLDRAQTGLQIDVLATLVCGRIEQTPQEKVKGLRRLRWTNAGHPPPLLQVPGQGVRVLDTPPEVLVGLGSSEERSTHEVVLPPGSTLLFYTDGLVERRGQDIDEGITGLRESPAWANPTLEGMLDELIAQFAVAGNEDDVALLAVRLHDEAAPRPAEAGPGDNPGTS